VIHVGWKGLKAVVASLVKSPTGIYSSLDFLYPPFCDKVEAVCADLAGHGYTVMPFETYRTQERQYDIWKRDRNRGTRLVAYHGWGLAVDLVPKRDGRWTWDWPQVFIMIGSSANAHGLTWGGDWKNHDTPHVQFVPWNTAQLLLIRTGKAVPIGMPHDQWEVW